MKFARICTIALTILSNAFAVFQGYIKFDGINGESLDAKHLKWNEILSYSHTMTFTPPARAMTGGVGSSAAHEDIVILKYVDAASPYLSLKCNKGELIAAVDIEFAREGGQQIVFYKVRCTEVFITAISVATPSGNSFITETAALNYATIQWTYVPVSVDGTAGASITTGWNLLGQTQLGKIIRNPARFPAEMPEPAPLRPTAAIVRRLDGKTMTQSAPRIFDVRGRPLSPAAAPFLSAGCYLLPGNR